MQVLMGQWEEPVVVAQHRLLDEVIANAEVVEEMVVDDAVVPTHQFGIEPVRPMHHGDGIGREQHENEGMLSGKINATLGPWLRPFWLFMRFLSVA